MAHRRELNESKLRQDSGIFSAGLETKCAKTHGQYNVFWGDCEICRLRKNATLGTNPAYEMTDGNEGVHAAE